MYIIEAAPPPPIAEENAIKDGCFKEKMVCFLTANMLNISRYSQALEAKEKSAFWQDVSVFWFDLDMCSAFGSWGSRMRLFLLISMKRRNLGWIDYPLHEWRKMWCSSEWSFTLTKMFPLLFSSSDSMWRQELACKAKLLIKTLLKSEYGHESFSDVSQHHELSIALIHNSYSVKIRETSHYHFVYVSC